eukprot:6076308-Alexandrium_andersonii.AAC.1
MEYRQVQSPGPCCCGARDGGRSWSASFGSTGEDSRWTGRGSGPAREWGVEPAGSAAVGAAHPGLALGRAFLRPRDSLRGAAGGAGVQALGPWRAGARGLAVEGAVEGPRGQPEAGRSEEA